MAKQQIKIFSLLFYIFFILLINNNNIVQVQTSNRISSFKIISSTNPTLLIQKSSKNNLKSSLKVNKLNNQANQSNNTNTVNPTISNSNSNVNNIIVNNNYHPRSYQVTAFCLSFFLPFGVAHFYIGRWWLGLLQLCFMLITPIIIAILAYCAKCCTGEGGKCCGINPSGVFICWGVFAGIWWLVDVILFGKNVYVDYWGYPLQAW